MLRLSEWAWPTITTSGLQNCETINFCCFKPCSLWYFVVVALGNYIHSYLFSRSVTSDSATPWTTAHQASLFSTTSQSLPKLIFIESVIPPKHLILCHPLLLQLSIFPSIRVFSNESAFCIRWPNYWSFSFSISPSNEYSEFSMKRQKDIHTLYLNLKINQV